MDELTQTTETTATPVVTPDASAPVSTNGNATGLDLNALNQQLSSLGNYSVTSADDVVKIIASTQKGMREAQEKSAKQEQRLRRVEPLLSEAETNPGFQSYLYEKANEYASIGGAGIDPSVAQVLNPVLNRIEAMELQNAERSMMDQLDSIGRDSRVGDYFTSDVKQDLMIEARASGNYDLASHFWRKHGPTLLDRARAGAKQEVVKEIQANANAYPQGTAPNSTGAVTMATPLGPNSSKEQLASELDRIWSDTKYRDKVLAEGR